MKRIRNEKAFTLIEVVLAVAMIAIIALPLLTVFLQSVKTDTAAKNVLNANYISQSYTERLDGMTYPEALAALPTSVETNGYYLTARIEPYGSANVQFDGACDFVHIVYFGNEKMLAVMPDGKWRLFSSLPSSISMTVSMGFYTFTSDSVQISGHMSSFNCMLQINAIKKNSASEVTISYDEQCKSALYCKAYHKDDFIFLSTEAEIYEDMITGDTSLIHVTTSVYDAPTNTEPVAISESYINIRNWKDEA